MAARPWRPGDIDAVVGSVSKSALPGNCGGVVVTCPFSLPMGWAHMPLACRVHCDGHIEHEHGTSTARARPEHETIIAFEMRRLLQVAGATSSRYGAIALSIQARRQPGLLKGFGVLASLDQWMSK